VSGDSFATRVYVVGEVLISVIALVGSLVVLFFSTDQGVKLATSGLLTGVTVFWFQRRQTEQSNNSLVQSNNAMATLANGKLTQLLDSQQQLQARADGLVTLLAQLRARDLPVQDAAPIAASIVQQGGQ
jgi:hypothetical protein